jgi:hypothetical protein
MPVLAWQRLRPNECASQTSFSPVSLALAPRDLHIFVGALR